MKKKVFLYQVQNLLSPLIHMNLLNKKNKVIKIIKMILIIQGIKKINLLHQFMRYLTKLN